jgi:hypothetical protein
MPEDEARFHLRLCGRIFSEQPRVNDTAVCFQVRRYPCRAACS